MFGARRMNGNQTGCPEIGEAMNCKNANCSRAINRANANICLVLALALVARVAEGQAVSPIGMSVSSGWTSLDADARQLREAGAHVHVGLSRRMASVVSSRVRLELGYHSIDGVADPRLAMPSSDVWTAVGSVVRSLGSARGVAPYLVVGAGSMSLDQGGGREAHLVLAFGGGVTLPSVGRLHPFVEGQFLRAMTGTPNSFIPISVGLSF